MKRLVWTVAAMLFAAACAKEEQSVSGIEEPLLVQGGTFRLGDLPGMPPPDDAGPQVGTRVTTIESSNNAVHPGEVGWKLDGHATLDARLVGVRFADLGTGYWTFPVGVPDPQTPGELTWEMSADFSRTLAPGRHSLRFVAFDLTGDPGGEEDLPICVPGPLEGFHSCDPKRPLPAAAVVLTWNDDVDLDLHVTLPDGRDVSPKHPTVNPPGAPFDPKKDAAIDRDSNAACVIDGARREQLTFPSYPASGTYHLRANLFAACGQSAVTFTMEVYVATGAGADATMVSRFSRSGALLAIDEDQTTETGLFVTDFIF